LGEIALFSIFKRLNSQKELGFVSQAAACLIRIARSSGVKAASHEKRGSVPRRQPLVVVLSAFSDPSAGFFFQAKHLFERTSEPLQSILRGRRRHEEID
jgi:hypothetical protein